MLRLQTFIGVIVLVGTACLTPLTSFAQPRVMDSVDVATYSDRSEIRIQFNVAMQYLTHEPTDTGDTVQVQLRPITATAPADMDIGEQETLSNKPTSSAPLLDVRYDGSAPGAPQLTLHFSRTIHFTVRSSSDFRSLLVTVLAPEEQKGAAPAGAAQPPKGAAPGQANVAYVINLESTTVPVNLATLPRRPEFEGRRVYTTEAKLDGKTWYRVRLGFFDSYGQASQTREKLQGFYPDSWISTAPDAEVKRIMASAPSTGTPAPAPSGPQQPTAALPPITRERLHQLMDQAAAAMKRKDYGRAIQLYTKILEYPDHPYRRDAQEFLGLARERNGQLAHAKAEYEKYLRLYPEGQGADRVRQRLAGILTAREQPRQSLRTATGTRKEVEPWEIYGSFSQFYLRDANITDAAGQTVSQSALSTDMDVAARRRGERYDIRTRFTGGYLYDMLHNGPGSDLRIASGYVDIADRSSDSSVRFGRQTRSTGGVLGRFDGLLFSHRLTDRTRLNLVTGLPVDSSSDGFDKHRMFYGASLDMGTFANAWDFVAYLIRQQIDGIVDRQAVGGEVRYFKPGRSLLGLIDYDTSYKELNTLLLIGNWTLSNKVTINTVVDYRKSPLLTTRNALQGQTITTIDSLLNTLTEDQVRQLAQDRSATSRTFTLGVSKPLNKRLQVSSDITITNLSSTPASGGVEAIPGTGNEYFYNLQLIGTGLLKEGDIAIAGIRYSDTSTANIFSVNLNSRYPVNSAWRVNPRLRVDFRRNKRDSSHQWTLAPSLRTDYRWKKRYHFELELGGEWSNLRLTDTTEKTRSYFMSMGYRIDF